MTAWHIMFVFCFTYRQCVWKEFLDDGFTCWLYVFFDENILCCHHLIGQYFWFTVCYWGQIFSEDTKSWLFMSRSWTIWVFVKYINNNFKWLFILNSLFCCLKLYVWSKKKIKFTFGLFMQTFVRKSVSRDTIKFIGREHGRWLISDKYCLFVECNDLCLNTIVCVS